MYAPEIYLIFSENQSPPAQVLRLVCRADSVHDKQLACMFTYPRRGSALRSRNGEP